MAKDKAQFTVAAFAIVFDEQGRVLLVHRTDYDLWNLPGGTLENLESPVDAVKREVKEETGFDIEVGKLVSVYSKSDKNSISFTFSCKIIKGQLTLSNESDKIEYFEIDKIPLNTVISQVERIKSFLEKPNEVIFKTTTGKSSIELIKEGKL